MGGFRLVKLQKLKDKWWVNKDGDELGKNAGYTCVSKNVCDQLNKYYK